MWSPQVPCLSLFTGHHMYLLDFVGNNDNMVSYLISGNIQGPGDSMSPGFQVWTPQMTCYVESPDFSSLKLHVGEHFFTNWHMKKIHEHIITYQLWLISHDITIFGLIFCCLLGAFAGFYAVLGKYRVSHSIPWPWCSHCWLVVWNMAFMTFHSIGNNFPNWLS